MKNRQTNHHLEINVSDIYRLRGDWAGVLLAGFVLTSGFESPPPPRYIKYNTLQKNNCESISGSAALRPHVHFGSWRVFVVILKGILMCVNRYSYNIYYQTHVYLN
ncbi:hypothetical protein C6501_07530 [Candidatus Poribacteria bacterium]|nr:MAG: hypothetical protein C6501_07530 [Candidatus Poribacteria bacterium]